MFTGIIETSATVTHFEKYGDAYSMTIHADSFFAESKKGDSISNNGVCLTIEECDDHTARFTLIHQTLESSAFRAIQVGHRVNVERACKSNSFLGGHYVMGHVDGVAIVQEVLQRETGIEVDLEIPAAFHNYIISKGSISLNGISLTVAQKQKTGVRVAIIPETIHITNIGSWQKGTLVNFEVDVLGKYVENLVQAGIQEYLKGQGNIC
jgi:riboflavin synthase